MQDPFFLSAPDFEAFREVDFLRGSGAALAAGAGAGAGAGGATLTAIGEGLLLPNTDSTTSPALIERMDRRVSLNFEKLVNSQEVKMLWEAYAMGHFVTAL